MPTLETPAQRGPACPAAPHLPPPRSHAQPLDSKELDFSRYGDVLFEVAFAGARLTTGGNVATEGKHLDFCVSLGVGKIPGCWVLSLGLWGWWLRGRCSRGGARVAAVAPLVVWTALVILLLSALSTIGTLALLALRVAMMHFSESCPHCQEARQSACSHPLPAPFCRS
jgi:hypothetical protein